MAAISCGQFTRRFSQPKFRYFFQGSGKTLAFAIPVLHHILQNKERKAQEAARELTPSELSANEELSSEEDMGDANEMMSDNKDSDNSENEEYEESSDDDDAGIEVPPFPDEEESEEGDFDNPPDEEDVLDFEVNPVGTVTCTCMSCI